MTTNKLVAGLLTGVAAGAIIGLLFTRKGVKIRKKIYGRSRDIAGGLKEKFNEFIDTVEEKLEAARQ